jgi:hypothetical protein
VWWDRDAQAEFNGACGELVRRSHDRPLVIELKNHGLLVIADGDVEALPFAA